MALHIRAHEPAELPWINQRYAEVDFQPSSPEDFIALAEVDGQRAALGRVVPVDASAGELGGMYVLPAFRGQSLADAIIRFLIANAGRADLYCIPFSTVAHLYARHGFEPLVDVERAPDPVRRKFQWCRSHYPDPVQLMLRRAFPGAVPRVAAALSSQ